MKENILISEIFGPTVQGEGPLVGRPTVFVRTGGCDYRCAWCDTLYAVLPEHRREWMLMTPAEIGRRIEELASNDSVLVTVSGGNPALQPLAPLIELGHAKGYTFALETQGSVPAPWFMELDWLILSPKPPSSHMATDWNALDACVGTTRQRQNCALKIVVFDDADYSYARIVSARYPALPIYLQVGNPAPLKHAGKLLPDDAEIDDLLGRFRWLVGKVTVDRWFAATVLPQLHVLAWGNKRAV
jgi:7-carboxy-7-deazaguanine synthase